jgi:hypothetical protein
MNSFNKALEFIKPDFNSFLQNEIYIPQLNMSLRVNLFVVNGDAPSIAKTFNIHQYNGHCGCFNCLHPGEPSGQSSRIYPYLTDTGDLIETGTRTNRIYLEQVKNALSTGHVYEDVKGPCALSRYIPCPERRIIDYMHCCIIGTGKFTMELLLERVIYVSNPKFYFRYVDDTFVIINNKNQAEKILEFLNSCHPTIKFTMEKEVNNEINFLDVKIKRELNGSITTSTYRKPTFTGVMLNWNSLTSIKYKKGLIGCLLDRSFKICSNNQQKIIEMEELRELLIKNNYPQQVIEKEFEKFEKYKMLNVDKIPNPNEKIKYLSIPFINDKSEIIGRKIQEAVNEHFTNINLRVAFKSPATLGSHFPFKDKVIDPSKLSMVVYHLKCKNCKANYIGQTKRICDVRMKDHQTDKNSHVYEHHNIPGHEIDFENVEILDRADTTRKLEYKEMLYIRKLKPTINKQTEGELFTLIIRNIKLESSMERDIQKYLKKPTNKNYKK